MTTYHYYSITNTQNNKKYIGISININERFSRHLMELRGNRHHSIRLQNAWNKYPEESFVFEILEEREYQDFNEAEEYEISLINKFDSKNNGYNMTDKKSPMLNPEIAEKVKTANQSKVPDIIQISMETLKPVNIFKSLREAERETGVYRQNISSVCDRTKIKAGGFYWAYAHDFSEFWVPKLNGKYNPVAIIENDKMVRVFQSAAQAGRELGLDRTNIRTSIERNGTCGKNKFVYITHEEYYKYFEACRDYSLS